MKASALLTNEQDRPWNDATHESQQDDAPDTRPTLKAVILDFSTIHNVDLTSVQGLIDIRNQLDRYAAPYSVQWHFASVNSRWTKRALAAGGFGYPSFETADGTAHHWKPIFSVAEIAGTGDEMPLDGDTEKPVKQTMTRIDEDVEMGQFQTTEDKISVTKTEMVSEGKYIEGESAKVAAVHGVNRPYFHVDVQSALKSAIAFDIQHESSSLRGRSRPSPEDSDRTVEQIEVAVGKKD
jgi:sodium-independent sulfate anion transporter 11